MGASVAVFSTDVTGEMTDNVALEIASAPTHASRG
jgi:hypothetical protein